jgi:CRP-like cAMP-binding protein
MGPGDFFGEMAMITGERRNATVRATGECTLLVVSHAAFEQIVRTHPRLVEDLGQVLARRQASLLAHSSAADAEAARAAPGPPTQLLDRIRRFFSL